MKKLLFVGILLAFTACGNTSSVYTGPLTNDDIQEKFDYLDEYINLHPDEKDIDEDYYPNPIGTYNGLPVIEEFVCFDLCPTYGWVTILYEGVDSEEECEEIEGESLIDPAFGGFLGCEVKIIECETDEECWEILEGCESLQDFLGYEALCIESTCHCSCPPGEFCD